MTTLENKINRVSNDAHGAKQILQALFGLLKRRKYFVIVFVAIIVVGFGIYGKYFDLTDAERAQKELAAAVAAVSKLMILPEGDEPVLATVTDADALTAQQAFFAGSVNGDQLLLFPKSLKAIIYSPSRNKIINAGPIEQQPQLAAENVEPQASTNNRAVNTAPSLEAMDSREDFVTIEIRNGTGKNGFGARVADIIQKLDGFEVLKVGDAESKQHKKTILVNRAESDSDKTKIQVLAVTVGAEIQENLPAGEPSSSADAVIIVGRD